MKGIAMNALQLGRMVETLYEDRLSGSTLQRGQYAYILYLNDHDGANQYDISRDLLIDKTTVAKALKKLEQAGMILRKTDHFDKRKVNVHLTAKGKILFHKVRDVAGEVHSIMTSGIHPSLVEDFQRLLGLFIEELDLQWCHIKNYKRTTEFSLASQEDYRKLQERSPFHLGTKEELFVERFEGYVLNWMRFHINEHFDAAVVNEIFFHNISDPITDGMHLMKQFEQWHGANYKGKILIRCPEGNNSLQKLLHKNQYLFKYYDIQSGKNVYTYEKGK